MNAREAQSGKRACRPHWKSALAYPTEKIEAPSCDHGMLQVVNGGQSAEMVISLRVAMWGRHASSLLSAIAGHASPR